MRLLIASDLHLEITGLEPIRRLVAGMDREEPDLIVLAGDLGSPVRLFEQCLSLFLPLQCPLAIVPGNRDVWCGQGESSAALYQEALPDLVQSFGYHWLESAPLRLPDGVAVAGSLAWYDYSALDAAWPRSTEQLLHEKPRHTMDALRVDWDWSDAECATLCRSRLVAQLAELQDDADVRHVVVATHFPLFEAQMERRPDQEPWSLASAFHGNLTLGEAVRPFGKVQTVVSGHTHHALNGLVERPGLPAIATAVVGSTFGLPRWITLDL